MRSSPKTDHTFNFKRIQRLKNPSDFRRVYASSKVLRAEGLKLHVATHPEGDERPSRLGITVRKAIAKTSVQRNRLKRWIRETARTHPKSMGVGQDLVVNVTQASSVTHKTMENTLLDLLGKAQR